LLAPDKHYVDGIPTLLFSPLTT